MHLKAAFDSKKTPTPWRFLNSSFIYRQPPIGLRTTMAISNMPGHIPSQIRCHWTCACIQCVRWIPVDCNPDKQLTWIRVNPVVLLCWKSCTLKGTDQVEYTDQSKGRKTSTKWKLPKCWRRKYNDIQQNPIYPTNTGVLLCGLQGTERAWSWFSFVLSAYDIWVSVAAPGPLLQTLKWNISSTTKGRNFA